MRKFLTDKANDNIWFTHFGEITRKQTTIEELQNQENFICSFGSPAIVNELRERNIDSAILQDPYISIEKGDILYYITTAKKVTYDQRMEEKLPEGTGLVVIKYEFL